MPQIDNADGATNVTSASACLNGTLLSTGDAPAQALVFWGETNGGTNIALWAFSTNLGYRTDMESLTVNIPVFPNRPYYYRFLATNDIGDIGWAAESRIFQTPGPPVVGAEPGAHPVGHTTATLHGHLAGGAPAAMTFSWGQNTNAWSFSTNIGPRETGPFFLRIGGLSPGQSYYYRISASNVYESINTAIVPFRTQGDNPAFAGGWYDGYDAVFTDSTLPGAERGSLFLLR